MMEVRQLEHRGIRTCASELCLTSQDLHITCSYISLFFLWYASPAAY